MIGMCLRPSTALMLVSRKLTAPDWLHSTFAKIKTKTMLLKWNRLIFFPLIRAILKRNKGTQRELLLCCSLFDIERMWSFNTSMCFALSLSMFASLREWNVFADNTFYLKLHFLCTCLVSLCVPRKGTNQFRLIIIIKRSYTCAQMWKLTHVWNERWFCT